MKRKTSLRESDYFDKVPNSNIGLYKKYGTPIVSKYSRYPFKIGDPVYLKQHNSVGFIIDGPTEEDPDFPEKGIGWGGEARTDVDGVQSLRYMVPFDAAKHSKADIPPSVKKVLFKENNKLQNKNKSKINIESKLESFIRKIVKEERRRINESSSQAELQDLAIDLIDYLGGQLPTQGYTQNQRIMNYFRELGYKDNDPMIHKIYNLALKLNR